MIPVMLCHMGGVSRWFQVDFRALRTLPSVARMTISLLPKTLSQMLLWSFLASDAVQAAEQGLGFRIKTANAAVFAA